MLRAKFAEPNRKSLRDELTSMVQEDPDAAASVLSAWIGEGP